MRLTGAQVTRVDEAVSVAIAKLSGYGVAEDVERAARVRVTPDKLIYEELVDKILEILSDSPKTTNLHSTVVTHCDQCAIDGQVQQAHFIIHGKAVCFKHRASV